MKTIILAAIFFFSCLSNAAIAQSSAWKWAKDATGETKYDEAAAIATDAAGNVYITGYMYDSSLTFGSAVLLDTLYTDTTSNADIFVAKYDLSGNLLWAKRAGGINSDFTTGITTDAAGNVYICGYFESPTITFGGAHLINLGSQNIFIAKMDPSGNYIWAKSAGGGNYDEGEAITADARGYIYMTGNFASSSIVFGSTTLMNADSNNNDLFTVKLDTAGNYLWAESSSGAGSVYPYSVSADAAGNVFIGGEFAGSTFVFGNDTLNGSSTNADGPFVAKYDSAGNTLWAQGATGAAADGQVSGLGTDAGGNAYATGYFQSTTIIFGSITLANANTDTSSLSPDVFVVKYGPSGNVLWARDAGGANDDYGNALSVDTAGSVYVTGTFSSSTIAFGNTTLTNADTNANSEDIFIAKYDPSGNILWANAAGGTASDQSNAVCADAYGNAIITGWYESPVIAFGNDTLTCSVNGTNVFTAKIGNTGVSGINPVANTTDEITVYPNPTTGTLFFKGIESGYLVEVYNLLGQVIKSSVATGDNYSINLSGNAKGVYFYRVTNNAASVQQGKIVVE